MAPLRSRKKATAQPAVSTKEPPSFFKIYLPELNSEKLQIPPDFIGKFDGNIPVKALLKNVKGDIWQVKLEAIRGKLYIVDDWDRYAKEHSLERGSFLVFQYIGNSVFFVKVFGLDGCVQEEPKSKHKFLSQAENSEEFGQTELDPLPLPLSSTETNDMSKALVEANDDNVETSYNIRFVKTFSSDSLTYVNVPSDVVLACNITTPTDILVRNEDGATVTTMFRRMADRVILGYAGLPQFWKTSKIKSGDQVEFQIVLDNDQEVKEVLIRILPEEQYRPTRQTMRSWVMT